MADPWADVRELLEQITAGPWEILIPYLESSDPEVVSTSGVSRFDYHNEGKGLFICQTVYDGMTDLERPEVLANTRFITEMRQVVPLMLEDLDALLAVVRAVEEDVSGEIHNAARAAEGIPCSVCNALAVLPEHLK